MRKGSLACSVGPVGPVGPTVDVRAAIICTLDPLTVLSGAAVIAGHLSFVTYVIGEVDAYISMT